MKTVNHFSSFLIIAILFLSSSAFAQISTLGSLNIYEQFRLEKRAHFKQYVASDETGHYLLYSLGRKGDGDIQLVKFGNDCLPTGQKVLVSEAEESLIGVIQLGGNLLYLSSISSQGSKQLLSRKIELDHFTVGNPKVIARINATGDSKIEETHIQLLTSPDKQSATLLYETSSGGQGEMQYVFLLLDKEFNIEESLIYSFPGTNKDFEITDIEMLNKREWIVLLANYKQLPFNTLSKKSKAYDHELFHLQAGLAATSMGKIPNDGKWVTQLQLLVEDAAVKIYGLYSLADRYAAHGTFFHKVSRSNYGEVVHRLSPFPEDVITAHLSHQKVEVSKYKEVSYYVPRQLFAQDDGSVLLLSEQLNYYNSRLYTSNILALKISAEGVTEWTQIIKKSNSHSNTSFSSYVVINTPEKCILIYNGDVRNINQTIDKRSPLNWYSNLSHATIKTEIDREGNVEQNILSKYGQIGPYVIQPRTSKITQNGELLILAQDPENIKNQRFLSLNLHISYTARNN